MLLRSGSALLLGVGLCLWLRARLLRRLRPILWLRLPFWSRSGLRSDFG
jgi:hypothetical protein